MDNAILRAHALGQSTWLDFIRRNLLTSGELGELVRQGVTGLTSNPTIFEKAISGSTDYDEILAELARGGKPQADIFEALAVEDIRDTADILRSVFDQSGGVDGYASLEVSPHLAHNTKGTIAEGRRLFALLKRPNVMIKVPATREGIPAVRALIAEGINVNVTLIFSLASYEKVIEAYLRGLEELAGRGGDPSKVASVASFFVSRIDTAVDPLLQAKINAGDAALMPLLGTAAVANAQAAYAIFSGAFGAERFAALRAKGARVQRPLWASTSTKNPAYPDTLYVDNLIGPDTVNTMPPATIEAVLDHGSPALTLTADGQKARAALAALAVAGVDMERVADKLLIDGVRSFADSYDAVLASIEGKCAALLNNGAPPQESLADCEETVKDALVTLERNHAVKRIWEHDHTLWKPDPEEIGDRLGWLTVTDVMRRWIDELRSFAGEVRAEGIRHVVLMGMGGSALAPEVYRNTFGCAEGCPEFLMLDSTVPGSVRRVTDAIDPAHTLFIVSSKSGGTIEVLSFYRHFRALVEEAGGDSPAGRSFVAITDASTSLAKMAHEEGFRRVFLNPADVGGRFSALSLFGLLPGVLMGMDVERFLDAADEMRAACQVPLPNNPGARLGAILGSLPKHGVDKLTLLTSPALESFGLWAEQMIAESLGKEGTGVIPVAGEPVLEHEAYGKDRFFLYIRLEGDDNGAVDAHASALAAAGKPLARLDMNDRYHLGAEMYRWEFATALAGSLLGVHPFNQVNVQAAKDFTNEGLRRYALDGRLPEPPETGTPESLLKSVSSGDYLALQVYLPQSPRLDAALQRVRLNVAVRHHVATTSGYGPRYLHSTGELHKGGPASGLFIQIVSSGQIISSGQVASNRQPAGNGHTGDDLPVPGQPYNFGVLAAAQALGDLQALVEQGRRVARIEVSGDAVANVNALADQVAKA